MKIDLEEATPGAVFRSDICIVGGGIAGLLLATRLAGHGISVNLVEAGGAGLEERSQKLFDVPMAGSRYVGATEARFRVFGGSSTRWGGQLLPLTDEIFEGREAAGCAGWPISGRDIERYYDEVQEVMGVNRLPFTSALLDSLGHPQPIESPDLRLRFSKWAPFSRRNLSRTLGRECLASEDVTVFLHANAVAVQMDPQESRATSVSVHNYSKARFSFEAAEFVICAGTIETCRLLLASTGACPRGVGNENDLVGRCFHDHISVPAITLEGAARGEVLRRFAPYFVRGTLHTPKLEASPSLQRQLGLLAVMAHVTLDEPEESGMGAARQLLKSLQRREWLTPPDKLLAGLPGGAADLAAAWFAMRFRRRRFVSKAARVQIAIDTEQRPAPENRIRLSEQQDAVGMPVAIVDWRVSDAEQKTVAAFATALERSFEAAGIHGVQWPRDLDVAEGTFAKRHDTYHAMGGTRFGVSRGDSVVDPNLQVHGVKNLFVASCSVFPSGGSSNPTFTLMALTLRLAERLRARKDSQAHISTGVGTAAASM